MRRKFIKLANTIHWDSKVGDKVYLDDVQMVIADFPFDTRQVILRFSGGPALDVCLVDMDRLALEYLTLRGIKPPPQLCKLALAKAPPAVDFVVPRDIVKKRPIRRRQR